MYAVVRTGGKQLRVSPGDVVNVEKLSVEPGATVELTDVLMVSTDQGTTIGTPTVQGAAVICTAVDCATQEADTICLPCQATWFNTSWPIFAQSRGRKLSPELALGYPLPRRRSQSLSWIPSGARISSLARMSTRAAAPGPA